MEGFLGLILIVLTYFLVRYLIGAFFAGRHLKTIIKILEEKEEEVENNEKSDDMWSEEDIEKLRHYKKEEKNEN